MYQKLTISGIRALIGQCNKTQTLGNRLYSVDLLQVIFDLNILCIEVSRMNG